jgi:hypothetical protein
MKRLAWVLLCLLVTVGAALAQEATDPAGEATATVEAASTTPPVPVTLDASDARLAICSASALPDFVPYVVRPGDHLAGLIAGQSEITVTQLAALNCLDDPGALPVGAVIWLPAPPLTATPEAAVTAEPTTEPIIETTPISEATDTAEPGAAAIDRFEASADSILNSDTVTFAWSARGDAAYFYPCLADDCPRPQTAAALPLEASISFGKYQYAGAYRYRLDVEGVNGSVTRDVSISVTCAQDWLGGLGALPLCPENPARAVFAVWQPFEHGVMIWFSDQTQVFVMTDDGRVHVYQDQFVEGDPNPPEIAPNERFTPTRGFGLLWEALGGASSPVGWGTAAESGYDAARQAAGHTSYTTYIAGPGEIVYAITQIPGVAGGYWTQVSG